MRLSSPGIPSARFRDAHCVLGRVSGPHAARHPERSRLGALALSTDPPASPCRRVCGKGPHHGWFRRRHAQVHNSLCIENFEKVVLHGQWGTSKLNNTVGLTNVGRGLNLFFRCGTALAGESQRRSVSHMHWRTAPESTALTFLRRLSRRELKRDGHPKWFNLVRMIFAIVTGWFV